MGKIQDLYRDSVRPMPPAERLQLARLILDELVPAELPLDVSDAWSDDDIADLASAAARHADHDSPRDGAAK